MWQWLFGKRLEDALHETRCVRVRGIRFTIKKVDLLNYLDGSKVLRQVYDLYKIGKGPAQLDEASEKKIREHYAHVLVAGVVSPRLSLKPNEGSVCVDELFVDWEMVAELYEKIMELTYGKKKLKRYSLAANG